MRSHNQILTSESFATTTAQHLVALADTDAETALFHFDRGLP